LNELLSKRCILRDIGNYTQGQYFSSEPSVRPVMLLRCGLFSLCYWFCDACGLCCFQLPANTGLSLESSQLQNPTTASSQSKLSEHVLVLTVRVYMPLS